MYSVIGYYICEQIKIPQFLKRDGTMVSVSECFGGIHPRLDTCFFQNSYVSEKDRDAHKKRWNLDAEKLANPDLDIRYKLPEKIEAFTAGK